MNREDMEAQRIMSELQTRGPAPSFQNTGNTCNQCGKMHPPLPPGQICPVAPVKNLTGITDVEVQKFLVNIKNIIVSQIQQRNVKDGKKFFQYGVIELTKALEKYKE